MGAACVISFVEISVITLLIPHFFGSIPHSLIKEVQVSTLIQGAMCSLLLIGNVFGGVLAGLHRLEVCAAPVAISRTTGAVAVLIIASHSNSLILMSAALGTFNLVAGVAQFVMCRRVLPSMRLQISLVSTRALRELLHFATGLLAWSGAGFLISGLDLVIVGHFDFRSVGAYAVATNVVLMITALYSSVAGGMMNPIAALYTQSDFRQIGQMMNIPKTQAIQMSRHEFFDSGVIAPLLVVAPAILATAIIFLFRGTSSRIALWEVLLIAGGAAGVIWQWEKNIWLSLLSRN